MNLEFKTNIKQTEFDNFVTKFPGTSFMQTSSWGKIKNSWQKDLIGVYEENKLVATALVLKRKLIFNKKIIYIPRGFVVDYDKEPILDFLINNIKKYAKQNKAITVKVDPFSAFKEYSYDSYKKGQIKLEETLLTTNGKKIDELLKKYKFKHGGYEKKIGAYIQPRYTMVIPLKKTNNDFLTEEELRKSFPKNTRNYIGKYHEVRGVSFHYSKNIKDVDKLIQMLSCTEKRNNIKLRNKKYFESLLQNFEKEAVLFFAEVNFQEYINFLKNDMNENPNKLDFCITKIKEATNLKNKYGDKAIMAATIVLMPTCINGLKIASFLYAGTNTEILPCLKATNGLMYYRLCYALKNNCDYCDLGGVDGTLNDHLSTFKSKFNPNVVELIGEYDLIINKFWFFIFKLAMKIRKKI